MSSSESRATDIPTKDAKQALAEDGFDDCMSCRVTGSAAFVGLGVYSYYTGMSNLRKQEKAIMAGPTKYKMGSRQLGIATISATLVGMGLWRAFN
ncbi:hypothetical protein PENARI_c004G11052 [Penicillium arizonense]|uniref:Distal membrane-arm assembly complex protein 1-like domain-containing protein n=1 Tax=Penicillium arizonense TaxID=1835702 RepID=A0A1F5LPS5_PENAI|nr:hypothetical protein PENARI_c004G11052 [Penicillium arizonense]KAJ6099580.1 hypothetical protein N7467_001115 [Penicillium canescens]OGE55222.1 hypothetical protein PENARI_c004G11052 [Penicillium arizonense]